MLEVYSAHMAFLLPQWASIPVTMQAEIIFSSETLMSFFWFGLKVMMNNNFWTHKRKGNFQPRLKTIAFNGCYVKNRTSVFKNVLTLLNATVEKLIKFTKCIHANYCFFLYLPYIALYSAYMYINEIEGIYGWKYSVISL